MQGQFAQGEKHRNENAEPQSRYTYIIRPLRSTSCVSDIAVFVLKRDVKLQPTDQPTNEPQY